VVWDVSDELSDDEVVYGFAGVGHGSLISLNCLIKD
jgi:hypothetical protein